jgi:protein-S-isoprenylcysteine O-methyltransferase Ste14
VSRGRRGPAGLFRVARPATPAVNVAKTLVQIVAVWTFALGLLPWLAVTAESATDVPRWDWPGRSWLGGALFAVGSAVGLASAWCMAVLGRGTPVPFDAARELVVAGPYRVVRNPMAVSALVQMLGVAVMLGSGATALLAVGGGLLWDRGIRPAEERFLAEQFGPDYQRYRQAVRCWAPRWPPYA